MNSEYTFPKINRNSYKPIYIQVSEVIMDYAEHRALSAGDLLPSENELIAHLDVSRNTIRQAVDRLAQMGFLSKVRGQGTFLSEKPQPTFDLDATQGFEGSLRSLGLDVENAIIAKHPLTAAPPWTEGLEPVIGDRLMLVRRRKSSSGRILALEDRILPENVVNRYSDTELKKENICPVLLGRFPDTALAKLTYYFSSHRLLKDEADALHKGKGAPFLQRIGEYYNATGDCFMVGRHIFIADDIKVRYEFEKKETFWVLT